MTDEAAKTYVEDEKDPGVRESTIAESDELRDDSEYVGNRGYVENPENVENVENPENIEDRDRDVEFADADEPSDFAVADEAEEAEETHEVVEADDYAEADEGDRYPTEEFTEPSEIVAVEEPDYPDYATPSAAQSSVAQSSTTQSSTTQADASEPLLASTVIDGFRDRWSEVQIGFVEDPQKSVAEADALLAEVTRAYQQAVEERRSRIAAVRQDGSADTEDLRSALLGYREIFTTMVANDR